MRRAHVWGLLCILPLAIGAADLAVAQDLLQGVQLTYALVVKDQEPVFQPQLVLTSGPQTARARFAFEVDDPSRFEALVLTSDPRRQSK